MRSPSGNTQLNLRFGITIAPHCEFVTQKSSACGQATQTVVSRVSVLAQKLGPMPFPSCRTGKRRSSQRSCTSIRCACALSEPHFPGAIFYDIPCVIRTSTGWVLLRARLPDQAVRECGKALDLDPRFVRGHLCLGEAYEQKGDGDRAAQEFLEAKVLGGDAMEVIAALKQATASAGYIGYFRTRLVQLTEKAKTGYVSPYDVADIYVRLGNQEEAMRWLNKALEEHSPYLVNLQIEPRLDRLRSDRRFQELVQRVGLTDVKVLPIDPHSVRSSIN